MSFADARVARLRIGLEKGSTRIVVERSADESALDFDLADERAVDDRFQALVESIALDERPEWVTDALAASAAELVCALQKAAPEVEFKAGGVLRRAFKTRSVHRETWKTTLIEPTDETVTLVGRLEAVDLKTGHFRIRDDVGNAFSLPRVAGAVAASHLIASYVSVSGQPERDAKGRTTTVREAVILAAPGLCYRQRSTALG